MLASESGVRQVSRRLIFEAFAELFLKRNLSFSHVQCLVGKPKGCLTAWSATLPADL
jgi:hypothetical protein